MNGHRHVLDDSAAILSRANQALATLERYKLRLDEVTGTLSALEIEDLVTVRDAVTVVQRLEMVRRIADEIAGYVVELGMDGRLLALQLDELMAGVEADRTLVVRDYLPAGAAQGAHAEEALQDLDLLSATELIDLVAVAKALGYPGDRRGAGPAGQPARVPAAGQGAPAARRGGGPAGGPLRQPAAAARRDRRGPAGGGRGRDARARGVREGLSRLAEASILERYV